MSADGWARFGDFFLKVARGKMFVRQIFGGKYEEQFERKSLRTIGKNLGDKFGSKLVGKHIGAQF